MVSMGNCLRCFCLSLPISWTILTFIFVIFVLVGNTSTAPFPSDTYFLRMNVSMIDPPVVPPSGETIARVLGIHDFYQTGLWNFCEGEYDLQENWRDFVTYCGSETSGYFFDPITLIANELLPRYEIIFIQSQVDAINTVQNTSGWIKATFVLTALFTGFTLIIGPLTGVWRERKLLNCLPVCTMCIAALAVFMGAVSATAVYFQLRDAFNNDSRLVVQAHMGHQMFAFVWLAVWTAWVAASQWCCAAICCPGGHRKKRITFKQPFTGMPPILPWVGSDVVVRPDSMAAPLYAPQPEHHHGAAATLGAAALAAGGLAAYDMYQHHQQQQVAPPPPPPPEQHHHGAELAAAGAVATGLAGYAVHEQHQHQHQQFPQPPPPATHHLGEEALVAGGVGLATAEAVHLHQQHQQQHQQFPQPPPPATHHLGEEALVAGGVGLATAEAMHLHQQHEQQLPQPPPIPPGVPAPPPGQLAIPEAPVLLGAGEFLEVNAQAGDIPVLPPQMMNNNASMTGGPPPPGPQEGVSAAAAFGAGYAVGQMPQPPPAPLAVPAMPEPPVPYEPVVIPEPVRVSPVLVDTLPAPPLPAQQPIPLPPPQPTQNQPPQLPLLPALLPPGMGPPDLPPPAPPIQPSYPQNTYQPPAPPVTVPQQQLLPSSTPAGGTAPPAPGQDRPDSELWHFFPFGPAAQMVLTGVDALFNREGHQQQS